MTIIIIYLFCGLIGSIYTYGLIYGYMHHRFESYSEDLRKGWDVTDRECAKRGALIALIFPFVVVPFILEFKGYKLKFR